MNVPVVIGNATLYLGDCVDVIPSLPGVDCIVTSPPYNQLDGLPAKGSGTWAKSQGGAGFLRAWQESGGYADKMDETEYQLWQNTLFASIKTNYGASLFYNHQVRWRDGKCVHPTQWFTPDKWLLRQEIIWDRGGGMMFNARMFVRFDERVLWFVKGDKWTWNQSYVGHGTIWRIAREQQQQGTKEHPVAFPLELPSRCIGATTDVGGIVLDPFMGSGTTGAAALQLGREFIGIEREPKYFDIACRRIEDAQRQAPMFPTEPQRLAVQMELAA